jgi:Fic family protein
VQAGSIAIQWLATADMPADGLTKALSKQKHAIFVEQLHLVDISSRIEGKKEEDDSIERYASLGVF